MISSKDKTLVFKPTINDLLLLLVVTIIFFHKVLFFDTLYYSSAETLSNFYPLYHFLGDFYKNFKLPLWDPYYYFSIVGINFAGVFYLPNIIMSVLISFVDLNTGFWILEMGEITHYWAASFFMYLLLRSIGVGRGSAILSGILYAYSGFTVKAFQQPTIINTITWFPLIFYLYFRSLKEGYAKAFLAGISLAMAFFAGYLNLTVYVLTVLFLLSIFLTFKNRSNSKGMWENLRPFLFFMIICFTGFLLAAPQNLPTLEYAKLSIRHGNQTFESLTALGSIPPLQLISFFTPQIYGATEIPQWIGNLVYVGYWEIVYYIGIFPLILSLVAILFRKDRITLFFSFIFVSALFLSLGKNAAPFGWLYSFPFFPITRIPSRFTFFFDFTLSILAGLGLDYLLKNRKYRNRGLKYFSKYLCVIAIILLGVTCIFYFSIHFSEQGNISLRLNNGFRAVFKFSILLLISVAILYLMTKKPVGKFALSFILLFVIIDIFHFTSTLNPTIRGYYNPENEFHGKSVVKFLKKDSDIFRTSGFTYPRWLGHINNFFNLGYTGGFSHKDFADFRGLEEKWGNGAHSWFDLRPNPSSHLIDFYNIKYFISEKDLSKESDKYVKVFDADGAVIFENKMVFPRAFIVNKYIKETNRERIIDLMQEIDLKKTVILERQPMRQDLPEMGGGIADIISYQPTNVRIKTRGSGGFLVLSDLFYPGWKAYINGNEVNIYRANYAFRAIQIPKGEYSIEFSYEPASFYLGIVLASATILFLLILLLCQKPKIL